jgi:hypothetical protein
VSQYQDFNTSGVTLQQTWDYNRPGRSAGPDSAAPANMISDSLAAALLGAAIGALAGVGGSAVGALASVRASQLASRVPLAAKIHNLGSSVVRLNASAGAADYEARLKEFMIAWNDLIVHQKILAPSDRLHLLHELVRDAARDPTMGRLGFPQLAGEALNASTDMIAAYSQHMFRWRAALHARAIARTFRRTVMPRLQSDRLRSICAQL